MGVLVEHAVMTSDGSRDGIRDAIENTKDLPASGGYFSFSAQVHGGRDKRAVVVAGDPQRRVRRAQQPLRPVGSGCPSRSVPAVGIDVALSRLTTGASMR